MFDPVLGGRIEIVRGRLSDERADHVRAHYFPGALAPPRQPA